MRFLLAAAFILLTTATLHAADDIPLAAAAELRARGGVGNIVAKLKEGGEVRIAYIGGSITAANGWRPKTTAWLQQQYPAAKIVETNAAIGGTGSDLGVFRFGRDVMAHKPHLIFVEFAVNDGGAAPAQIHRAMEGMVRQAWATDPAIDIIFVYTLVEGMAPTIAKGQFPRSASAMEQVADHYGIPTIHMGIEVSRLAAEGKMVMKANPKTDEEKAALKDKIIFSGDGVHPHANTGHEFYLHAVARSWEKMAASAAKPQPHKLPAPMRADNYERAKLVPLSAAKLSGGWEKLPADKGLGRNFGKYMPELYGAKTAGQTLTFRFKGTHIGFLDLLGPDCGQVSASVDGHPGKLFPRFDSYCTYPRIASFAAGHDLPEGSHTVTITTTAEPLDKAKILSRLNNTMDDPKRFEGNAWYVGWIMLVGEVEE